MTTGWGDKAEPAGSFQGHAAQAVWLPNERVAHAWEEYVRTGEVSDTTGPPAPKQVRGVVRKDDLVEITWEADADLESGLRAFVIQRDGQDLGQVPQTLADKPGRPLFLGFTYHDTPETPPAEMRYLDSAAKAGTKYAYQVIAVNGAGLRSEPVKATFNP